MGNGRDSFDHLHNYNHQPIRIPPSLKNFKRDTSVLDVLSSGFSTLSPNFVLMSLHLDDNNYLI